MTENALAELPTEAPEVADANTEAPEGAGSAPAAVETPSEKEQRSFEKLTKEKYKAYQERDQERWQRIQLEKQLESLRTKQPEVVPQPPTLESSGFDDAKYQASLAEYTKTLAKSEVQRILKEEREAQQVQARVSEFDKRQAEFAKSKPDYAEKVIEGGRRLEWACTDDMAACIRDSEIGPAIAYHLAENPEIAAAIAGLPVLAQAREIGRIEAKLESQKAAPAPKVSSAPPPPAKIEASEPGVSVKPDDPESDKLSDEEWFRQRNKQVSRRRG